MLMRSLIAAVLFAIAILPAGADVTAARQRLHAGDYLEAAKLGEADGTAAGLALAAEAYADYARCPLDGNPAAQKPYFQRAYDLAGQAIERDASNAEAWLLRARGYARLLDYEKKAMSIDRALKEVAILDGYLNRANSLTTSGAAAPAMRGRVEIGKLVASQQIFLGVVAVFGDRDLAYRDLCTAIDRVERDPEHADYTYVYYTAADGLWSLDSRKHAGLAAAYANRALEPCGDDARCRCVQKEARALKAEIQAVYSGGVPQARRICPVK